MMCRENSAKSMFQDILAPIVRKGLASMTGVSWKHVVASILQCSLMCAKLCWKKYS